MSVQPTSRSLAGSGSLDASNVAELAGRVFEVLANGQETIGIQAGYGVFLWMFTEKCLKTCPNGEFNSQPVGENEHATTIGSLKIRPIPSCTALKGLQKNCKAFSSVV